MQPPTLTSCSTHLTLTETVQSALRTLSSACQCCSEVQSQRSSTGPLTSTTLIRMVTSQKRYVWVCVSVGWVIFRQWKVRLTYLRWFRQHYFLPSFLQVYTKQGVRTDKDSPIQQIFQNLLNDLPLHYGCNFRWNQHNLISFWLCLGTCIVHRQSHI